MNSTDGLFLKNKIILVGKTLCGGVWGRCGDWAWTLLIAVEKFIALFKLNGVICHTSKTNSIS